jgi:excisionase family DNA binding protein
MLSQPTPVVLPPGTPVAAPAIQPVLFERLLDSEEAAQLLGGVNPKTLMKWARNGEIPGFQIRRHWYFRASALDRWLTSSPKIRAANVPA